MIIQEIENQIRLHEESIARLREAKRLLEQISDAPPPVHDALIRVCVEHGVTMAELLSSSRKAKIVAARRKAARMLREEGKSWKKIGSILCRHHSTVMHLVNNY